MIHYWDLLLSDIMTKLVFNVRSAYGQLILLVFLPIMLLAVVGGYLVFSEVRLSTVSEQEALAQAALMGYEARLRPVLTDVATGKAPAYQLTMQDLTILSKVQASPKSSLLTFFSLKGVNHQEWLKRVAVLDDGGQTLMDTGISPSIWQHFRSDGRDIERIDSSLGTAYGLPMQVQDKRFWLFVEMDNRPLHITYYRVALALIVTGLITLMLLLLILNIYSKRWIAPIYEMRLSLQKLTADNLQSPIKVYSDGEFFLLQRDFVQAMRRLSGSFEELKRHAKETEDDLQQAFDEMEMQNISIRQARDLAISSSQAKSAFLANISHELRTPLNSIDGFINLLARHNGLTGEQNLYVQTIKKSSAHLLALVNDVLDFSKIEAGKLVLEHHQFDLYTAIYDVVDMLSPAALEKHLRLCVLFYNDVPCQVMGDSLRVKQVLTNLVGNAIKFTDTGGVVVTVSLSADKDDVLLISVEDTGKGISESDKAQLFQSFSQGDLSVTRRYGGTGLGLVISKQLTELMQGDIGFFDNNSENIAKSGTTFWFEMPLDSDDKSTQLAVPPTPLMQNPMNLLVWINHAPTMQALKASLATTKVQLHFAIGLADLLEQLDNPEHGFDWVLVDYFGQDAAQDDVGAILRQIRLRYQGKLSVYGYQVGMDMAMLNECKTFALYEPLDKRQLYAMLCNQTLKHQDSSRQLQFTGTRVLAVDDHQPNLLVLQALLAEFGVEVITVNSGFDAIEMMSKTITGMDKHIDLIFMDIQMPKMSGLQASIQIRKIEEMHQAKPVPIIALTAHGLSDEKDQLVASGLNDYVGKPIGYSQLAQTLQKWLGRSDEHLPESLSVASSSKTSPPVKTPVNDTYQQDIDWQDALERSANKPELAKTLLGMIIDNAESEKLSLEQAWASRDRASLADITHRMVGASRYTGVPRLRQTSQDFENRCRADIGNSSASQFISMRPSYRALIDALDSLGGINLDSYLTNIHEEKTS